MRFEACLRAWICGGLIAVTATAVRAAAPADPVVDADKATGELPTTLPVRRNVQPESHRLAWNPALAVLALAGAAGGWWVWRRRLGRRGTQSSFGTPAGIVRLSSQALTPQASVHAVQWAGEELLLGCSPQGVVLLSRRSAGHGVREAP